MVEEEQLVVEEELLMVEEELLVLVLVLMLVVMLVVDDKILTDTQAAGNSADLSEIKENIQSVQDAAKTLSDAQADVTNTETTSSQQDKA